MPNRDNHRAYDAMAIETMKSLAYSTGLSSAPDVEIIVQGLGFAPSSILEVGAGAGRVVDALLATTAQCDIFALERAPNFIDHLRSRFASASRVRIMTCDVSSAVLPKIDVTLWLWAGIADFAPDEQPLILSRLAARTRRVVVLETPADGTQTTAHDAEGQWFSYSWKNGTRWRGYVPTADEIRAYAEAIGFYLHRRVDYTTEQQRHRTLYFLRAGCRSRP